MPAITPLVQISFTTNPFAAPAWVSVTDYVESLSIRRGRQHRLNRDEAGSLEVKLKNTDRRFEALFAAGAYYPNVDVRKRIRAGITDAPITYITFEGFINKWHTTYPHKAEAWADISANDGFEALARTQVSGSYPQERSDLRVARVLDAAGWPSGTTYRDLKTGISDVQAFTADRAKALQHLEDVVNAEGSRHFISRLGKYTFHSRHTQFTTATMTTSQATFSDTGAGADFALISQDYDDAQIYNDVSFTRVGGAAQTASDATSQGKYWLSGISRTGLLITGDTEVLSAAQYFLSQYKNPQRRFGPITIYGSTSSKWSSTIGMDLNTRVTVIWTPPGGGAGISTDLLIEGIAIDWDAKSKTFKWVFTVGPLDKTNYFVLDSVSNGILDTNKLAY